MIGGPKLSSFKIGGPKLQKVENRGTKTAIKPIFFYKHAHALVHMQSFMINFSQLLI
jgi:hypothetical protein